MADYPIPGNPEKLRDLARRLESGGRKLKYVRTQLSEFDQDRSWKGPAADAFRERTGDFPKKLALAEARFRGTARALRPYAETLEEAKQIASRAQPDYEEAWRDLNLAREVAQREPKATSHGAVARAQEALDTAEGQIAKAKKMVEEAAGRCATAIAQAIDDPLRDPDDWLTDLEQGVDDLFEGAGKPITDIANAISDLVTEPGDFFSDVGQNAYDMVAVWNYGTFTKTWTGFGKEVVAWDDWMADRPSRATGHIATNAALTALGFGAGKLAMHLLRRRRAGDNPTTGSDPGLANRGRVPAPGTRVRPTGLPEEWRIVGAKSRGGTRYYDPANPGNSVRVMQGNPKSPHKNSRKPYVRWQHNGQPLDRNGKQLPSANVKAAHIPLAKFRFIPEVFE
jgi:hypothetical protein